MNTLRLGKKPATEDKRDFLFAKYVKPALLPEPPAVFGHDVLPKRETWGMLGNDEYGDCVWAGAAHEFMLWKGEADQKLPFTTQGVLSDYSAVTGFDPNDPSTDQGTWVRDALKYRQNTGTIDANGRRHKIKAYAAVELQNIQELWQAVYLFGAVGIGFNVPNTIWDQWDRGLTWDVTDPNATIDGGHYVPIVGRDNDLIKFVTWGQETTMTQNFYNKYVDEAWAMLSTAPMTPGPGLVNAKSPEGFDWETLKADLGAL